jgi:hypothetical protein
LFFEQHWWLENRASKAIYKGTEIEAKLIGITTFRLGDNGNLNFAVSLDEAFPLLEAVK